MSGIAYEHEDGENPLIYDESEFIKAFISGVYCAQIEEKVAKVECGENFTLALTASGKVYSWGMNIFGQLGLEHSKHAKQNTKNRFSGCKVPTLIEDLDFSDEFVIDIAGGSTH